ncbi:MAG: hypothetical protein NC416_14045, partial [Eubacterium sp.]|nr:hypothetical protein [Eubacterium sp.]
RPATSFCISPGVFDKKENVVFIDNILAQISKNIKKWIIYYPFRSKNPFDWFLSSGTLFLSYHIIM